MADQGLSTKINDLLADATPEQRKWVAARVQLRSDAEAARKIGVRAETVCRWQNKTRLDQAVAELTTDACLGARFVLADAVLDAAKVKVEGLRSSKEQIQQDAATEILDRGIGKVGQPIEFRGHLHTTSQADVNIDAGRELAEFIQAMADAGYIPRLARAEDDQVHTASTDA